jgi:S-adenosylmethionine hydrolase
MPDMGRPPPVIGFLTDFGLDGAAATCRAVMLSICPDAHVVDIAHTVPKYAIADGGFIFAAALPYFPVGHHVAVVDPGVGTERRPVALRTERGDILVGPDNGLLLPAADALGGATGARALSDRAWWLPVASSTFHGRDIFSPVAAHLATGDATFEGIGEPIDPADLVRLPEPTVRVTNGSLQTEAIYVDTFGNVRLAGDRDALVAAVGAAGGDVSVRIGGGEPVPARFAATFGEVAVGETLVYIDSSGHPALAENQGNLAARTSARRGDGVVIERT